MNTPRITDIAPLSAISNVPAAARPAGREQPAIPELPDGSAGGAGVSDATRQRVDAERAARSVEKATLAEEVRSVRNFSNRVGYYDGSSMVFVDLIDAQTQRELMRIFGPSRTPPPDDVAPEDAAKAYDEAGVRAGNSRSAGA